MAGTKIFAESIYFPVKDLNLLTIKEPVQVKLLDRVPAGETLTMSSGKRAGKWDFLSTSNTTQAPNPGFRVLYSAWPCLDLQT